MGHILSILVYGYLAICHGDLDRRITSLTADIALYPDSAQLYQSRGALHLLHEDYDAARHDFTFCLQHHLVSADVYLGLSKSYVPSIDPDSALYFVDQALLSEPDMQGAMEWKARLLLLLQNPCEAGVVYDQLLHTSSDPSPALYIDAGRSWNSCSGLPADPRAIRVLNDGLSRLGNILVLQKELVNQYLQNGDFSLSLEIQNQIVEQASRKTKPLMSRAAIHVSMGNTATAKADLELALLTLDQLPVYRSGTPAMKALRENILSLLKDMGQ